MLHAETMTTIIYKQLENNNAKRKKADISVTGRQRAYSGQSTKGLNPRVDKVQICRFEQGI
jgi:hypothetical protein